MITIKEDVMYIIDSSGKAQSFALGSKQGFSILSKLWLRSGWDTKYVYGFSWLGRPIIQLPEDMLRIQEVIYAVKPDFVIETGIAHGGSLVFYAGLLSLMGKGKVIGVDIEIRDHNRAAIESHELSGLIDLIEGPSVAPDVIRNVEETLPAGGRGIVILDSNHTKAHVLSEIQLYAKYVAIDSYIVVCDGIMKDVVGAPRTNPTWAHDNPQAAVTEFLSGTDDFVLVEPEFPFNEGEITERVTYWPNAFLKRVK